MSEYSKKYTINELIKLGDEYPYTYKDRFDEVLNELSEQRIVWSLRNVVYWNSCNSTRKFFKDCEMVGRNKTKIRKKET